MNPISDPGQMTVLVSMFVAQLPVLIVSVLGCVIVASRRNELGAAASWALMGFGLSVVLCVLIPVAQLLVQNWVMQGGASVAQRASMLTVLALVWSVARAVSFGLLLLAIVAGRQRPAV